MNRKTLAALAALLVALGTFLGAIVHDDSNTVTKTIPVPAEVTPENVAVDSTGDGTPDKVIEVDAEVEEVHEEIADAPNEHDFGGDLRGDDSTPIAAQDGPLATPHWPGCSTRFLPTNWSNRTSSVRGIGLHYTAGPNRAGLADMDGLTSYASSSRAGVSWHFLIDAEGHCYYNVPVNHKAWTIGNLNSQTVNIEVIGLGSEKTYPAGTAGATKLRKVVRRIGRVFGIPMRLGATNGNCTLTRSGIITHWMGGSCSGGHHDIRPYSIERVIAHIAKDPCGKRCRTTKRLKAKHQRTHAAFRKNRCKGKKAPRHGYCNRLRARNKALHRAARHRKIKLG